MPEPTNTQTTAPAVAATGNSQAVTNIPGVPTALRLPAAYYFQSKTFDRDLAKFQKYKDRKTGYSNLDAIQPLYPGFYVVGAISSLGKTTCIHQMADQVATAGVPVLYFSLEQNALELYSKSISRRIYQHSFKDTTYRRFSSIDIRRGLADGTRELQEQQDAYITDVENRLCIVECNFTATVEQIEGEITNFINAQHVNPVVVIDYLQIISPSTVNNKLLEGKSSIDHIVHSLKSFQNINNLTVIAICSLNRQNYLTPIDFESFKESGGIEYTADVVWGLQLSVIHDDIFSKDAKLKEKRETILKAKNAIPRDIELVVLKNRYGRASYSVDFTYNPIYDTFEPVDDTNWTPSSSSDSHIKNLINLSGDANPFA